MNRCTTAAGRPWRQPHKTKRQNKVKTAPGRERQKAQSRVSVTALMAWPRFHSEEQNHRAPIRWQHRLRRETPNMHRAIRIAPRECGWKHGDSGHSAGETNFVQRKNETTHLTPTGLLMEGHSAHPCRGIVSEMAFFTN